MPFVCLFVSDSVYRTVILQLYGARVDRGGRCIGDRRWCGPVNLPLRFHPELVRTGADSARWDERIITLYTTVVIAYQIM